MTHDEATQACLALFQTIGEQHARRIMAKTLALGLEPDSMEGMVHACIDELCADLREGGACEQDVEAAGQHVYAALVKEGGRIARNMTWEHGHA